MVKQNIKALIIFITKLKCMRKFNSLLLLTACYCFVLSCNSPSPEKYFTTVVLNTNLMHGFAGAALNMQLESPSVKMVGNDPNKTEPMKRKEIIDTKIQQLEEAFENVNSLKETEDSKGILDASKALFNYVLPVYKNEYTQLAKLYDDGAAAESIQSFTQSIGDKHHAKFVELHDKLTEAGKAFATKHNINVQWDVRTSPK